MTIRLLSQNGLEYKFNLTPKRKTRKKKKFKPSLQSIGPLKKAKVLKRSREVQQKNLKSSKGSRVVKRTILITADFSEKLQFCCKLQRGAKGHQRKYDQLLIEKSNLKILKTEDIRISSQVNKKNGSESSSQELYKENFDMNFIRSGFTPESGHSIFKSANVKK